MMTDNEAYCRSMAEEIAGLSIFSRLRRHPLLRAFTGLLDVDGADCKPGALIAAWGRFTALFARYAGGAPFSSLVRRLALADVNRFALAAERGDWRDEGFETALTANDLAALSRAAAFDFRRLAARYGEMLRVGAALTRIGEEARLLMEADAGCTAEWTTAAFADLIRKSGAGDLAGGNMYRFANGKLHPARNGDTVRLADLSGYTEERQVLISNTERFLSAGKSGTTANNILLYGDRGCGKSATVKAVCNEYASRGLRLVELQKADIPSLPAVMSMLGARGLRFILFIDDLSFGADDGDFMTLKAMLEGGVETKPPNVVIYATSNRRHLVKEPRAGRPESSSDVRAFDTMQEQLSLADRFGVTVIFSAPSQDEYLRIAEFLARKHGALPIDADDKQLKRFRENAVRWERWFNGRSPRTAAQFVEWLSAGDSFPWAG